VRDDDRAVRAGEQLLELVRAEPVGVVDQPEFRNAAVALDAPAGPNAATGATALLVALKQLERAFGVFLVFVAAQFFYSVYG